MRSFASAFRNDYFRFGATLIFAVLYSALRTTEYSTVVKPLPVLLWAIVVLLSPKRPEANLVFVSLSMALIGDVLLDLGDRWLIIATVPFLGSTLLLAFAFHLRTRKVVARDRRLVDLLILVPIVVAAVLFYRFTAPFLDPAAQRIGAVLLLISVILIWRSLSLSLLAPKDSTWTFRHWVGLLGASGIVANYLLYSINLGIHPVPRDLVIQVYYWGQAFAAWSFLLPRSSPTS